MNEKDEIRIGEIVQAAVIKAMNGFIGKFIAFFSVIVVVFLFIIGGSFTYTSRVGSDVKDVEAKCTETQKDVDYMRRDMQKDVDYMRRDIGTISETLSKEYPESMTLEGIYKRNLQSQGDAETD